MPTKTKIQIIDETVEAYSDPNNRAIHRGENEFDMDICSYLTADGKMCAFGRCELKPIDCRKTVEDRVRDMDFEQYIRQENIDKLLKPEYRGHELCFWSDVQRLHDITKNFDEGGPNPGWSEYGRKEIARLKDKYAEAD